MSILMTPQWQVSCGNWSLYLELPDSIEPTPIVSHNPIDLPAIQIDGAVSDCYALLKDLVQC
jgi:hypothetical protein